MQQLLMRENGVSQPQFPDVKSPALLAKQAWLQGADNLDFAAITHLDSDRSIALQSQISDVKSSDLLAKSARLQGADNPDFAVDRTAALPPVPARQVDDHIAQRSTSVKVSHACPQPGHGGEPGFQSLDWRLLWAFAQLWRHFCGDAQWTCHLLAMSLLQLLRLYLHQEQGLSSSLTRLFTCGHHCRTLPRQPRRRCRGRRRQRGSVPPSRRSLCRCQVWSCTASAACKGFQCW